ncbi:acyl-CoA dehydrogenase family protein [Prolixibacter denitrificans]|uniref:Acyl-CoA dehydrogenase n=1 Tax=Prolixibacter denitrificans TaxID=1541063 RepID=A0A2P8CFM0_9BACT|nr:acyl-CoA dehydrogenase family protein [Prolixibacter denitrificans]PSK83722.1 alkylation response protein AidB-like acyl-CoA dehydrogenase [Prolixibacter denitrificans]GET23266.1 acyl-CoA dehydrogenase [Prolixibacter denitrificans]
MTISESTGQIPFSTFLNSLKETLKSVFYERDDIEKFIQQRGFPAVVLRDIMSRNPLSVAIPEAYGGRGVKVKECLGVLETASYESLPLSLIFGINIALFLEPVVKYAQDSVKGDIFKRFLNKQNMGGLMITEPDYGSDALNMQTFNVKEGSHYHIQGTKHWQGLTGMADYWLMTSRPKTADGRLGRDIDFFVCDAHQPEQRIEVQEYYNNIGLYPIPYGKNIVDIKVPEENKLKPETTGLKLMMDLLHRSRFQFPGMGMGFIHRMMDEAIEQVTSRFVGGKSLMSLDQVKHQITRIQSAFTISSAMCSRSAEHSGIEHDLSPDAVEAGSMKAFITDLMQESAQTLTQLLGANGYKAENVGSRGIMDSRPFQIFEGSNDMLYTQISEGVLKMMRKKKEVNLLDFFQSYNLTERAADYFKSLVNFKVDFDLPQRKVVDLGKIISKVIAANHVVDLGTKGFRGDLIKESIETIRHDIAMLVSSYKFEMKTVPVVDYREDSSWLKFS